MAKGRLKLQDVAEVYIHYADGQTRFFGCMNTTAIEKTIDTEDIRCGIGWNLSSLLYSNSDMSLTLTPAYWNEHFLEMQAGSDFDLAESVNVWTHEQVDFTVSTANVTATIVGTPVGGIVKVQNLAGETFAATFATGTVTVTGGATTMGAVTGIVSYQKAVTGDVLTFRTDVYPKVAGMTLYTFAFDVESGEPAVDIYFDFPKVIGDGAFNAALTGATNSVNEMTVRVLPVNRVFGTYTTVDLA